MDAQIPADPPNGKRCIGILFHLCQKLIIIFAINATDQPILLQQRNLCIKFLDVIILSPAASVMLCLLPHCPQDGYHNEQFKYCHGVGHFDYSNELFWWGTIQWLASWIKGAGGRNDNDSISVGSGVIGYLFWILGGATFSRVVTISRMVIEEDVSLEGELASLVEIGWDL